MSAGCRQVGRNCKTWEQWRCRSQHQPGTLIPDITLVNIRETLYPGLLRKIETLFSFVWRGSSVPTIAGPARGKDFNFFWSVDLLPPIYHATNLTRCCAQRTYGREKPVNLDGPPCRFSFTEYEWFENHSSVDICSSSWCIGRPLNS